MRLDLEREILAAVLQGGVPVLLALRRTPWDPSWMSGPRRLAVEAAEVVAMRGEAISPDAVAGEMRRRASEDLAEEVRAAAADAIEAYGAGATGPGAVEALAGEVVRLSEQLGDAIITQKDEAGPPAAPTLLGAADIFAPLPPVRWLCEPLVIAPGAPTLIAGYGFSGKTLAAQDLALAVATGTRLWGRFPVRAGRVVHVDFEQGAYLTRLRYQRLLRARGIDPRELEGRLTVAPLPSWYLDSDPRDELMRLCDGMDLVLIDSFRAAAPQTDESSSEARVPLDRLTRISEATGTAQAVIHHARKPVKDAQGGARMSVRGSGALYDACGSVLVFGAEKGQPVRVTHEKARLTGRTYDDLLLFIEDVDVDGDPAGGLRVSATLVATGAPTDPAAEYQALRVRVLETIRQAGVFPGGTSALRARLGGRKEDISAVIADLVATGAIQRGGTYREPTLSIASPAAPVIPFPRTGTDKDGQ